MGLGLPRSPWGERIANRLDPKRSLRWFAALLVAVAAYTGIRSAPASVDDRRRGMSMARCSRPGRVDHARSDHGHHLDRDVVLAHLDGVRPEDFER